MFSKEYCNVVDFLSYICKSGLFYCFLVTMDIIIRFLTFFLGFLLYCVYYIIVVIVLR